MTCVMILRAAALLRTGSILLFCWAILSTAPAATIVVDNLATAFLGQSAVVHATQTVHLDLSGFAALTPGEPIRLTLAATAPLRWFGGFWLGEAGVSFEHDVLLELTAGTQSVSASYSWRLPELGFMVPGPQPPNTTNIVGFTSGPRPADLTLVVPWGTDLSDVKVTLIEDSRVTGAGTAFSQSSIAFNGQAGAVGSPPLLHVASVPEPSVFGLIAGGIAVASGLRRRRALTSETV